MIDRAALSGEHAAILQIAGDLLDRFGTPDLDMPAIVKLRWQLAHALAVHLAKEDKFIYPRLKNHDDARIAALAHSYEREMGSLAEEYRRYMADWTSDLMLAERDRFERETRKLLTLLAHRVDREEAELYPMYETSRATRIAATAP